MRSSLCTIWLTPCICIHTIVIQQSAQTVQKNLAVPMARTEVILLSCGKTGCESAPEWYFSANMAQADAQ
jgi:hypothetical protein